MKTNNMTYKQMVSRIQMVIIKQSINNKMKELRIYNKYKNYIPIGQRISEQDPYGEENWDE